MWMRLIKVYCAACREWYFEKDVKVLDIEEDIQGRDHLKFICPKEHKAQSPRIGAR